jgi:hypothetical protein
MKKYGDGDSARFNAVRPIDVKIHLGMTLTNKNDIHDEIKNRLNSGNACYYSVQNLLSSRLISKNLKIKIYNCNFASCTVWVRNLVSHFEGGT